ncbi:MAG: twin transmembrane helix small protein [Candidatus Protistobacter heckmanni]|nr:twin transmembrane helix small protein [Candidatus Protistobacter heckmanni]
MRVVIAIAFVLIIASLGSALFYLMRDKGKSNKTVYSLALRVGLSIALFLFILFANWMGWIHSTGIPLQ